MQGGGSDVAKYGWSSQINHAQKSQHSIADVEIGEVTGP